MVQASLDSRPASTTTARHIEQKTVNEIKILVKDCEKCLFLQPMLSATKLKSIFDFLIFIPPNKREIDNAWVETIVFTLMITLGSNNYFVKSSVSLV